MYGLHKLPSLWRLFCCSNRIAQTGTLRAKLNFSALPCIPDVLAHRAGVKTPWDASLVTGQDVGIKQEGSAYCILLLLTQDQKYGTAGLYRQEQATETLWSHETHVDCDRYDVLLFLPFM
jgi:hypothetical protein